ncbi:uncharacterized protein [Dysidea avara]|uniref:uncharacterized protein isoform X1 n=1 Tax=Dysidea avara TaxID=196820 RepID=UPI00332D9595
MQTVVKKFAKFKTDISNQFEEFQKGLESQNRAQEQCTKYPETKATSTSLSDKYKVKDFDKSTAYGATASLNGDALLAANKQYNRLWTKHYKMPMKLIQSKLQHCSEKIKTTILPTSKNAAEDYCQVVMTVALQATFNYAKSKMIDILMFPITEDIKSVQNSASTAATSLIQKIIAEGSMMHSSEPEMTKQLKFARKQIRFIFDEKDEDCAQDSHKLELFRMFQEYKYTILYSLPDGQVQMIKEDMQEVFLATILDHVKEVDEKCCIDVNEVNIVEVSKATSEAIWCLLRQENPILLESLSPRKCRIDDHKYNSKRHSSSTTSKHLHQVCAYARPVVINSDGMHIIEPAIVFLK